MAKHKNGGLKQRGGYDYRRMNRKMLVEHCTAYAMALRELTSRALRDQATIFSLRLRLARLRQVREFFHG